MRTPIDFQNNKRRLNNRERAHHCVEDTGRKTVVVVAIADNDSASLAVEMLRRLPHRVRLACRPDSIQCRA